ncbi:MAG: carboxylating nicotinate-nucleotide diphosphorylase [Proteobacteria bacterium]|nr:carboxylating nicotinate-nucleotide diphosphorylase [Pseudomonadota bacterium]
MILSHNLVLAAVRSALDEDLGLSGDITTNATVEADARADALLVARKAGVVSGLALAEAAFRELDPACRFEIDIDDGNAVTADDAIARISGNARAILSAERVALNFMGRMCGIATLTRRYVEAVAGTRAKIVDTRKTTPGLRVFEKYAVRCGGADNHRFGLFDAILVKDNHIVAAGSVAEAIKAARASAGHMTKIEVEVDTLDQLDIALREKIDCVLLDNMSPADLRTAVKAVDGRCLTEASGGVNLDTVREIALTGVDLISVGALTHSAPVLDLGLDFVTPPKKSFARPA